MTDPIRAQLEGVLAELLSGEAVMQEAQQRYVRAANTLGMLMSESPTHTPEDSMVQTMPKVDHLIQPVTSELQRTFEGDVTSYEKIDWNEKSRIFLENLHRSGYVLTEQQDTQNSG